MADSITNQENAKRFFYSRDMIRAAERPNSAASRKDNYQ
jgi:hypothetical protein